MDRVIPSSSTSSIASTRSRTLESWSMILGGMFLESSRKVSEWTTIDVLEDVVHFGGCGRRWARDRGISCNRFRRIRRGCCSWIYASRFAIPRRLQCPQRLLGDRRISDRFDPPLVGSLVLVAVHCLINAGSLPDPKSSTHQNLKKCREKKCQGGVSLCRRMERSRWNAGWRRG